jgi:hypothetical protein
MAEQNRNSIGPFQPRVLGGAALIGLAVTVVPELPSASDEVLRAALCVIGAAIIIKESLHQKHLIEQQIVQQPE